MIERKASLTKIDRKYMVMKLQRFPTKRKCKNAIIDALC